MRRDVRLWVQPRAWQEAVLEKWKCSQKGVVEVVTGGGKTIFAFLCVEDFLSRHHDGRVVIVVPTVALADQWYVGLREDLGCDPDDIAVFSGKEKAGAPATVNVSVINTARDIALTLSSGAATFLVVDECHRAATPVNSRALEGKHTATLGLSATPLREYDDGFERYLAPVLGPLIFSYSYEDAYSDGIIAPFSLVNVRVELLSHERARFSKLTSQIKQAYRRYERTGDDASLKRLLQRRAAVSASAATRIPVAVRLIEKHRGERAIVFHESIRGAEQIARILRARRHSVAVYHSRVTADVRRDNLRLFRKGVFDVLVSCRALDEGMNVPETTVAVIASSTASERQRIQRLGRVLRPAKGKDHAIVYTLYATQAEERRLINEAGAMRDFALVSWQKAHLEHNG